MKETTEKTRQEKEDIIEEIVKAAHRPFAEVVPCIRQRNILTGRLYSIFGMPWNFKSEDFERVQIGWVYRDSDGSTYGTIGDTKEEMVKQQEDNRTRTDADFRKALREMSKKRFQRNIQCWLPDWKNEYFSDYMKRKSESIQERKVA